MTVRLGVCSGAAVVMLVTVSLWALGPVTAVAAQAAGQTGGVLPAAPEYACAGSPGS